MSSTPRSFFQSSRPSRPKAYRPSEPNNAIRRLPSVAKVEFAWVALVWRLTFGAPRWAVVRHRTFPDRLLRHSTSQLCSATSSAESPEPYRPTLSGALPALLAAVVTHTRSFQITGLEWARPDTGVFQRRLRTGPASASMFHDTGTILCPSPRASGPRKEGQFSAPVTSTGTSKTIKNNSIRRIGRSYVSCSRFV